MYNPFTLLTESLLEEKLQAGLRYFVRQTYPRGLESRMIASFLIKGYAENLKNVAEEHMHQLSLDPNRFLYDVHLKDHEQRLRIAARQPFGYKVFFAVTATHDWKPSAHYQSQIRRYIRNELPSWRTKPGEKIGAGLLEEFGRLFVKLSLNAQEEIIPLERLENY